MVDGKTSGVGYRLNVFLEVSPDRPNEARRVARGTPMKALSAELFTLIEAGDLHALMIRANRAWLERYYPQSSYASLVVDLGVELPAVQEVFISGASAGADPGRTLPRPL